MNDVDHLRDAKPDPRGAGFTMLHGGRGPKRLCQGTEQPVLHRNSLLPTIALRPIDFFLRDASVSGPYARGQGFVDILLAIARLAMPREKSRPFSMLNIEYRKRVVGGTVLENYH